MSALPPPPAIDTGSTPTSASKTTKVSYRSILRVFQQNIEIFLCIIDLHKAVTSGDMGNYFRDGSYHNYADTRQLIDEMYLEKLIVEPMLRVHYYAGELSHRLREACGPNVPRMKKDAFIDYINNDVIKQAAYGNVHIAWDSVYKLLSVPFKDEDKAKEARRQIILQEILLPKTESLI